MSQFIHLLFVILLGIYAVLPEPTATVKPALQLPASESQRLSIAQHEYSTHPLRSNSAINLAEFFYADYPSWALTLLQPFANEKSFKVHELLAYTYWGFQYQYRPALEHVNLALQYFAERCPSLKNCADEEANSWIREGNLIKMNLFKDVFSRWQKENLDPTKNPDRMRQLVHPSLKQIIVL